MELWKPIQIEGYLAEVEVSNLGRVRRSAVIYSRTSTKGLVFQDSKPARMLAFETDKRGYSIVSVRVNKKRIRHFVHRLVASAFISSEMQHLTVNHINGIKTDNRPENLEWVTVAENTRKQWETGLVNLRGERHPSSKLKDDDIRAIRSMGGTNAAAAREFGVSTSMVEHIRARRRWASVE